MQRKSFLGPKTSLEFFTVCCHILIAQVSVYTTAFGHIQCVALQILAIYGCTDIQYKYFLSGFMATWYETLLEKMKMLRYTYM